VNDEGVLVAQHANRAERSLGALGVVVADGNQVSIRHPSILGRFAARRFTPSGR
jgi:hypothetical protein